MKAEERKALEANDLAQELNKAISTIKQGPSRSTTVYFFLGLAILGGALLFRWFWRSSEAASSQRWVKLDEIVFPQQLDELLTDSNFQGTQQGRIVSIKEARLKLAEGIRDYGTNSSLARKNLEEGTKLYEGLVDTLRRIPQLHQEAIWGAAKGNEALGDFDKAKQLYTRLVQDYPASPLRKEAESRLERLESDEGKRQLAELLKAFEPPQ